MKILQNMFNFKLILFLQLTMPLNAEQIYVAKRAGICSALQGPPST